MNHSQWSKSRCFSGILLLFLWSNRCWQFDLCFLCLFEIQLEHLEVLSSHTFKPKLENFEHYFAGVWNECICAVVRIFFVIAFLWDWNENWSFSVLWPLLSFPKLLAQLYIYMHVSVLSQTPLPSRLPHTIKQSSLCYTVRHCQQSFLNIAMHTFLSQTPYVSISPTLPHLATLSSFSESVSLFLFCK